MARQFVTVGDRRLPLKTEAERRVSRARKRSPSRMAGRVVSLPRPGIPKVYRRSLAPRGALARRTTSLGFLLALIIGLDLLRRWPVGRGLEGGWPIPNMRGLVVGYLGAVLMFGVAAMIAPGFTTLLVAGIVAIQFVRAAPSLAAWTRRIGALLGDTIPAGRPPATRTVGTQPI